jgi:hypothetical protein
MICVAETVSLRVSCQRVLVRPSWSLLQSDLLFYVHCPSVVDWLVADAGYHAANC